MPLRVAISLTCPPSPCGRLSRPRTITGTPSPWGSPPVGDPAFRARTTFRTVAGALFVTLRLATPTQSPGACRERKSKIRSHRISWRLSLTIMGTIGRKPSCPICLIAVWSLGFMQFSLHHAVRVSTGRPLGWFSGFPPSRTYLFPSSFRLQVGSMTQRYHAQPLPSNSGIVQAAMRRTRLIDSLHGNTDFWPIFQH